MWQMRRRAGLVSSPPTSAPRRGPGSSSAGSTSAGRPGHARRAGGQAPLGRRAVVPAWTQLRPLTCPTGRTTKPLNLRHVAWISAAARPPRIRPDVFGVPLTCTSANVPPWVHSSIPPGISPAVPDRPRDEQRAAVEQRDSSTDGIAAERAGAAAGIRELGGPGVAASPFPLAIPTPPCDSCDG